MPNSSIYRQGIFLNKNWTACLATCELHSHNKSQKKLYTSRGLFLCIRTRRRIPLGRGNIKTTVRCQRGTSSTSVAGVVCQVSSNNTADTIYYSSTVTGGTAAPQINPSATWHYLYLIYLSASTTFVNRVTA